MIARRTTFANNIIHVEVNKYTSIQVYKYTSIHVYFAFVWGHRWNAEVELSCSMTRLSLVVAIQGSIL